MKSDTATSQSCTTLSYLGRPPRQKRENSKKPGGGQSRQDARPPQRSAQLSLWPARAPSCTPPSLQRAYVLLEVEKQSVFAVNELQPESCTDYRKRTATRASKHYTHTMNSNISVNANRPLTSIKYPEVSRISTEF